MAFSWKGLVVFLLPMLPNLLFFIKKSPITNDPVSTNYPWLEAVEHGSQIIFIVCLIMLVSKKKSLILTIYPAVMGILLFIYYGLWIGYFFIGADFTMLLFMAIIPVLYFIVGALWLHNLPAFIFSSLFGIAHIAVTYLNYYQ